MRTSSSTVSSAELVYLSGTVIHSLIHSLPKGTAYSIGIVLMVMMSGRLVQTKGSLARAVWPLVYHLKWGWHRVERALERGKLNIDDMIDQAYHWSLQHLEVEAVCLGPQKRHVMALDSSTIARLRSKLRNSDVWGKGYCHLAGRAVKAQVVAALVSVVLVRGTRLGLLRRLRFGSSAEAATKSLFTHLPALSGPCLIVVDAGIASKQQFATATPEMALAGRLRKNCCLRAVPHLQRQANRDVLSCMVRVFIRDVPNLKGKLTRSSVCLPNRGRFSSGAGASFIMRVTTRLLSTCSGSMTLPTRNLCW